MGMRAPPGTLLAKSAADRPAVTSSPTTTATLLASSRRLPSKKDLAGFVPTVIFTLFLLHTACSDSIQDAVHITAILGESVVFNCHVEFPEGHPVPYVLQWEKKVGDTVRTNHQPY
ncbi:unnamed protein product [Callosobruchus maculatus]|uniref:Uncharacterized protein n=1 Tax=Callosobruchus maculatus TaxID=64391 RepID=A0A653D000_CALMS|nr:unnamed protein product [Callosobruchus maculatus]